MNQIIYLSILACILSALATRKLIPYIIRWDKKRHVLVQDMNKLSKPKVPSLGGLAIVLGFILSATFTLFIRTVLGWDNIDLSMLLPGLLSIVIMAFVGFIDDVLVFPTRPVKPILALFASIPMIALVYSSNTITIPFIGELNIGLLYPLFIIPLIIVFGSNAINTMADFDGLTPGNGLIITSALFYCAWLGDQSSAMLLFAGLAGALLVFWFYNKYPAKIFSGNIGTLFVGCVFAVGAIIGHLKVVFWILMIPYLIHFILQERIVFVRKSWRARPRERAVPQRDGTIKSEYKVSYGLTHFFMIHCKRMTERKLVGYLMAVEAVCAVIAVVVQMKLL